MRESFVDISEPRVVYEDARIIVAAKPAGMHCAPASEPRTLCSWLFERRPEVAVVAGHRAGEGGLLHRLDSATNGLVVFARDDEAFASVSQSASAGLFVKTYLALGAPSTAALSGSRPETMVPTEGDSSVWSLALRRGDVVDLASMLGDTAIVSRFRSYGPGRERVACALPDDTAVRGGKTWTRDLYRTEMREAVPLRGSVLVEVRLTRGFRHQIRAHMAWIGLPLLGDALYGEGAGALRLMAFRVSLPSPDGGERIVVELEDVRGDMGAA